MKDKRTLRTRALAKWPKALGLAALSWTLLTPAMAHDTRRPLRHHGKHHVTLHQHHARHENHFYDRHHYRSREHGSRHREFAVPVRLTRTGLATYRDYHHGSIYYRPHRHYHAVYRFPVYTDAGWTWKPHDYCNGDLYRGRERHHNHQVRFSIRF